MAAPDANAPALLRQEVLDEARRTKDEILCRARERAEAILAKAEREAAQIRQERMRAAQAEAARKAEAILATIAVETSRARSARIEELLQAIHLQAHDRLRARSGFDFRKAIAGLAVEALRQMAGEAFRLRLSVADHRAFGSALVDAIHQQSRRSNPALRTVADPDLRDGEVMLETEEGSQVWNLGLEARLERCWPELRRQIGAHTVPKEQGAA